MYHYYYHVIISIHVLHLNNVFLPELQSITFTPRDTNTLTSLVEYFKTVILLRYLCLHVQY